MQGSSCCASEIWRTRRCSGSRTSVRPLRVVHIEHFPDQYPSEVLAPREQWWKLWSYSWTLQEPGTLPEDHETLRRSSPSSSLDSIKAISLNLFKNQDQGTRFNQSRRSFFWTFRPPLDLLEQVISLQDFLGWITFQQDLQTMGKPLSFSFS